MSHESHCAGRYGLSQCAFRQPLGLSRHASGPLLRPRGGVQGNAINSHSPDNVIFLSAFVISDGLWVTSYSWRISKVAFGRVAGWLGLRGEQQSLVMKQPLSDHAIKRAAAIANTIIVPVAIINATLCAAFFSVTKSNLPKRALVSSISVLSF